MKPVARFLLVLTVGATGAFVTSCAPEQLPMLDADFSGWTQLNTDPISASIPGHGNAIRNIFINDIGTGVTKEVIDGRVTWTYPEGTIIIKTATPPAPAEGSAAPSQTERPAMLLGMVKQSDNPRNQGGWVWLTRDPRTGEERVFDSEYCVTCHADANERRSPTDRIPTGIPNPDREFRDFVFYPYIRGE